MKHADKSRRMQPFTLIELVTVLAIIMILASMLLPSFSVALRRARAVNCNANLKNWAIALDSYAGDYNEYFPGLVFWGNNDIFTTNYSFFPATSRRPTAIRRPKRCSSPLAPTSRGMW